MHIASRHFILNVIFALISSWALAAAPELTEKDKVALKLWGNHHRETNGALLTPPRGHIDPQILETKKYIESLVEKIAGQRLRDENYQIYVNLYATTKQTIFATANAGPFEPEGRWHSTFKDENEIWPIRTFLGRDKDKKPIVELGVTVGLLSLVKTEDELAAVIAHELSHVLEHHVFEDDFNNDNEDSDGKKKQEAFKPSTNDWWSSQRHEAIADHTALELLLGKYDLDALTSVILRLSKAKKPVQRKDYYAYFDALTDTHHEGVRIAMAQGYIEYLRRTDALGSLRGETPLPEFIKLHVGDRRVSGFESFEESEPNYLKSARLLLKHGRNVWIFSSHKTTEKIKDGPYDKLSSIPSAEEIEPSLVKAMEIIRKARVSKQIKGDSFLNLLIFTQQRVTQRDLLRSMSYELQQKIARLLLELVKGDDGWRVEPYFEYFNKFTQGSEHSITTLILNHPKMYAVLDKLVQINAVWAHFAQQLPHNHATSGDPEDSLAYLDKIVENIFIDEKGDYKAFEKLNSIVKKSFLEYLSSQEFAKLLQSRQAHPDYFNFIANIRKWQTDHGQLASLQEVFAKLKPFQEEFRFVRVRQALDLLKGEIDADRLRGFVSNLSSEETEPFTDGDLAQIEPALLAYIDRVTQERYFPDSRGYGYTFNNQAFWVLSRLLVSPNLTKDKKNDLLKYLASTMRYSFDLPNTSYKEKTTANIENFMKTLSREEFMSLFTSHLPSIIKNLKEGYENPRIPELQKLEDEFEAKIKALDRKDPKFNENFSKLAGDPGFDMMEKAQYVWAVKQLETEKVSSQISLLTYGAITPELSQSFSANFNEKDLEVFCRRINTLIYEKDLPGRLWPNISSNDDATIGISNSSGMFLLDVLIHNQSKLTSKQWFWYYMFISKHAHQSLEMRRDLKDKIQAHLIERFKEFKPDEVYRWIKRPKILRVFDASEASKMILNYLNSQSTESQTVKEKGLAVQKALKDMELKENFPDLYDRMRGDIAENYKIQPHEIQFYFPDEKLDKTDVTKEFSSEMRGLSGLVALTRDQSVNDQIHMIEYLMGRRHDIPGFVDKTTGRMERYVPVQEIVKNTQEKLKEAALVPRLIVADSFLAGSNSMLENPQTRQEVLEYLLRDVKSENKELAHILADALLESRGQNQSLALAYVFAQKGEKDGAGLTEEAILRSLFEAYGVAGIKLGQYLSFTSELSGYQEALASLQDAAMPLNYYDIIKLINKRFVGKWPMSLRVQSLIGSGSVNVAIEYIDENKQNHSEVVSLARESVNLSIAEDFYNLNRFVQALLKTKDGEKKFGHLPGLLKIIKRSVELELNKENAMRIQRRALPLYDRKVKDWHVKTLEVYKLENLGLFMGKTARKVFMKNRAVYNEAMGILGQMEMDILLGIDESGKAKPTEIIVNPDFHDGQVLIDEKSRTITILDFGQALTLTNDQRAAAIELLRVTTKAASLKDSSDLLNKIYQSQTGSNKTLLTEKDLESIWARTDRMDIFVRVISLLEDKGFPVPLEIANWVLAVNRQIALGKKVGNNVEHQVRNLLITRKLGAGLETYNRLHLLGEKLGTFLDKCAVTLSHIPMIPKY